MITRVFMVYAFFLPEYRFFCFFRGLFMGAFRPIRNDVINGR
jgi:hypothetical protein